MRAPEDGGWRLVFQGHYGRDDPDGLVVTTVGASPGWRGSGRPGFSTRRRTTSADTVELEATLFGTDGGDEGHDAGSSQFTYREYLVVVRSDGCVLVHERVDS